MKLKSIDKLKELLTKIKTNEWRNLMNPELEMNQVRAEQPSGILPEGIPPSAFREIVINKVENGFIVRVACKTFVAKCWEEVSAALELYFKNPYEAEKKYCSK